MRIGELPNTFSLSGRVNFTYCLNITQKLLLWDKGEKTSLQIKGNEYRSRERKRQDGCDVSSPLCLYQVGLYGTGQRMKPWNAKP